MPPTLEEQINQLKGTITEMGAPGYIQVLEERLGNK
jgi:hypothetical protein